MTDEEVRQRQVDGGRKGGKAKVPKGIAKLSKERRREIARLGAIASNKKQAEKRAQAKG